LQPAFWYVVRLLIAVFLFHAKSNALLSGRFGRSFGKVAKEEKHLLQNVLPRQNIETPKPGEKRAWHLQNWTLQKMPLYFNLKNQSLQFVLLIHAHSCSFIDFFVRFCAHIYTFLGKKNMLALLITSLSK